MKKNSYKILVSDDSILARKQLIDLLHSLGYSSIVTAKNGQEAIDLYKSEHPDLVLLDIVMPVKDGIAATKEIMEFDPDADIIISSSVGTQKNIKQAILLGAKDFLQKPLQEDALKKILEQRHVKEN